MSKLSEIIDICVQNQGLKNASELATELGVSRQYLSRARRSGTLSDEQCLRIAQGANIDPGIVLVARNAIRDPEPSGAVWQGVLDALSTMLIARNKDYRKLRNRKDKSVFADFITLNKPFLNPITYGRRCTDWL